MNFGRAVFVVQAGRAPAPALAVLRAVAPALERLLVLVREAADLDAVRAAAVAVAPSVEVVHAEVLDAAELARRCAADDADLLVFAAATMRDAASLAAHRRELHVPVLWPNAGPEPALAPIAQITCIALDARAQGAIEVFLRDRATPAHHVRVLSPVEIPREAVAAGRLRAGIDATIEVSSPPGATALPRWLAAWVRERPVELVVCATMSTALLVGAVRDVPILLVPPLAAFRTRTRDALDVADAIEDRGAVRLRVDRVGWASRLAPIDDGATLELVDDHRTVATVVARGGEVELPNELSAIAIRRAPTEVAIPIAIVRPGLRTYVLCDAELADDTLAAIHATLETAVGIHVLAVRLRPTRPADTIRARFLAARLSAAVVDARAVLDEGDALDVAGVLDAVRLARVAARLARAGFAIAALVHRGPLAPDVDGAVAIDAGEVAARLGDALATPPPAAAAAPATPGNRIELELDNATARAWLLDAIAAATTTFALQLYMAADDDIGAAVEASLAAAGARGVVVRVLVDSLHARYGSPVPDNPLLARLAQRPGVELRAIAPITTASSWTELKQRDHRKLAIADGRIALVGGRNLGHEYYAGFDEVALAASTPWREVPWLDGGGRLEGPIVAELAAAFRERWREAGGGDFAIEPVPPAGSSSARVVLHHGLRDARTLDTYRALIDGARAHVTVVNGFPLVLELQHALVRACARGVAVRVVTGHVAPTHAGEPFPGALTAARTAMTDLVHSRLDPIVAAGGEVWTYAPPFSSGWDPELGVVHAHVHAKVTSVDGERCTIGSANLDVTAAYWESELLVVVEDPAVVRALDATLAAVIAGSTPLRRDDPAWQRDAARRAWMRRWPGLLAP